MSGFTLPGFPSQDAIQQLATDALQKVLEHAQQVGSSVASVNVELQIPTPIGPIKARAEAVLRQP